MVLIRVDGPDYNTNLDIKPGLFHAPAWSPAGDGIALATQNEAGEAELILAGEDGKVKQVLASLSGPVTFAWSPKGIHLAYTVYDASGPTPTIRLVVLDSSQPELATQVAQGDVVAFFWSPDGRKIAYFTVGTGGSSASSVQTVAQSFASADLVAWVYDRASGTTKQVATFTPTDAFQQIFPYYSQYQRSDTIWSPDSQALVLSTVDPGVGNAIYTVGVDGGHLQEIAEGELAFWAWK